MNPVIHFARVVAPGGDSAIFRVGALAQEQVFLDELMLPFSERPWLNTWTVGKIRVSSGVGGVVLAVDDVEGRERIVYYNATVEVRMVHDGDYERNQKDEEVDDDGGE